MNAIIVYLLCGLFVTVCEIDECWDDVIQPMYERCPPAVGIAIVIHVLIWPVVVIHRILSRYL